MPRKSMHRTAEGKPKRGIRSRELAEVARGRMIARTGVYGPSVHIYLCDECSLWHIGRWSKPTDRRRRVGIARSA
jgi:hypothetical protein